MKKLPSRPCITIKPTSVVVIGDFNTKLGTPGELIVGQIDFIMTTKRQIFLDVSVIRKVKTSSGTKWLSQTGQRLIEHQCQIGKILSDEIYASTLKYSYRLPRELSDRSLRVPTWRTANQLTRLATVLDNKRSGRNFLDPVEKTGSNSESFRSSPTPSYSKE